MPTPLKVPYGPFWPLGLITVAAVGTPAQLAQNIGTYYTQAGGSEYAAAFNQFYIRASLTNTGNIYLVAPGQPASNTGAILIILAPGEFVFLGSASWNLNVMGLGAFELDADTNGNSAQVTGFVQ